MLTIAVIDTSNVTSDFTFVVSVGYLLDMLFNKPISDIDVFYSGCGLKTYKLQTYFTSVKEGPTGPYPDGFEVTHTCTFSEIPVPIQFIKVKDVDKHIETFPSDMMKVKYSLKDGLTNITPALIYDAEAKVFQWDKKVGLNYYTKIKNKYSDWNHPFSNTLDDPTHNLEPAEGEF